MDPPRAAEELSQFLHCCRWMSVGIPDFAQCAAPLQEMLEQAYKRSGKRTKRSIRRLLTKDLGWGPAHERAFSRIQDCLRKAVTLAYPDPKKVRCVFTDASQNFWAGVVTQTTTPQLRLPVTKQQHEPIAFLGAAFKGAQRDWTTFEKEGFAIFQTFLKMDYLLQGQGQSHVYTDHRNLLFVFAPLALEPALGRHIVSKVQRWALYLSRFPYVIEHVDGVDNVCADILTRWTRGYRNERQSRQAVCSMVLEDSSQMIPAADEFAWPDFHMIRASQRKHQQRPPGLSWCDSMRQWTMEQRIWIPSEDLELQLKILVVSHGGTIRHRGMDGTKSVVKEHFWWPTIDKDVTALVRGCLHCIVTRRGDIAPRPLGTALHAGRPNEVLHMDYLYMGKGTGGKKYLLLIRDDLSSYVWLWPTVSCTAEATAEALGVWIGCFGSMEWLVTDQGTHFKNELIAELTNEARAKHHFVTAYCPWAIGSIERVCREVLRACKALISEWGLSVKDWPNVTECVQSVLNHAPLVRLGLRDPKVKGVYRTPLESFTGHRPVRPLLRAMPISTYPEAVSSEELTVRRVVAIETLQQAGESMHRELQGLTSASRRRKTIAHNKQTGVQAVNFEVGDFVLVRRANKAGHKLQFTWQGPRRIKASKS